MVEEETSPGKADMEYEVRGKVVLSCVTWRILNGKLLLLLSRNSEESCVKFRLRRGWRGGVFSIDVTVNQWLTG